MAVFDCYDPLKNETVNFDNDQIEEIEMWFDENAEPILVMSDEEEPRNAVTVERLQDFLSSKRFHRRCYRYPTYGEIMEQVEKLKMHTTRTLTKDQVIYILNKYLIMPDLKHELKLAFKVFDTEKRGYLELDNLTAIVTGFGNVFEPHELSELLRDANVKGDGNVLYEEFVDSIFSVAPELYQLKAEFLYEDPEEDPSLPPPEPEPIQQVSVAEVPPTPPPKDKKKDKKKDTKKKK